MNRVPCKHGLTEWDGPCLACDYEERTGASAPPAPTKAQRVAAAREACQRAREELEAAMNRYDHALAEMVKAEAELDAAEQA